MNLKWLVFLDQLLFRVIRISGNTRAITKPGVYMYIIHEDQIFNSDDGNLGK